MDRPFCKKIRLLMSVSKTVQTYIILLSDDSEQYIVELPNDLIPQGTGVRIGKIEYLKYTDSRVTSILRQRHGGRLTGRRADIFGIGHEYQSSVTVEIVAMEDFRCDIIVTAVDGQAVNNNKPFWTDQSKKEDKLRRAIEEGDFKTWESLLNQGVDVTTSDNDELTALHFAAAADWDYGKGDMANIRVGLVNRLLDAGADPNQKGWEGWTPLHDAACNWNPEIAELMIRRGASLTVTNDLGETPLHVAVAFGRLELVKVFLDAGADVDVPVFQGETVLHYASRRGNMKVLNSLLGAGAEVNTTDAFGRTALHRAAEFGLFDAVETLVEANADVTVQDVDGQTPLGWVVQRVVERDSLRYCGS